MDKKQIESVVPHSGEMVLLDRVVDHSADSIVTIVDVSDALPCGCSKGIPAYIGIELMAQSIAAWSGLHLHQQDLPPKVGFLLGVRNYICQIPMFKVGAQLRIQAKQTIENEGLSIFNCQLSYLCSGQEIDPAARGTITVYLLDPSTYQPMDMETKS